MNMLGVPNFHTGDPDPVVVYELQPFEYQDVRELPRSNFCRNAPEEVTNSLYSSLENTLRMLPEIHWRNRPGVRTDVLFDRDKLRIVMFANGWVRQRSDGSTWFLS